MRAGKQEGNHADSRRDRDFDAVAQHDMLAYREMLCHCHAHVCIVLDTTSHPRASQDGVLHIGLELG